ncbi:DUF2000 domain-containing protein [Leifsonia sp. NPDC058292]|uniref:DUF2000 domain-containing protein n=1 Tax=Leifsonia sp. NPDC058292 TaxID=3346428 RepID=UPI0036DEE6B8
MPTIGQNSRTTIGHPVTLPALSFAPEEIRTDEPTRSARLKWVIVVDESLPAGRAVNATACVAAATASSVGGLLGPDAVDSDAQTHPGLPWAGCSILGATPDAVAEVLVKAQASEGVHVATMPEAAQSTRVYDEYLETVARQTTAALRPLAVSIVGPRNRVDKLVKRLSLLP